jgi:DNA-binding GntR family transcriptional regulator
LERIKALDPDGAVDVLRRHLEASLIRSLDYLTANGVALVG